MDETAVSSSATPEPVKRQIGPLLPVLLGLMVSAIAVFAYWTQYAVVNSRQWVLHTYEGRSQLQTLETELADVRGRALGYGISADESQLRLFSEHIQKIPPTIQELRRLTTDNSSQQQRLSDLESLWQRYASELEKTTF